MRVPTKTICSLLALLALKFILVASATAQVASPPAAPLPGTPETLPAIQSFIQPTPQQVQAGVVVPELQSRVQGRFPPELILPAPSQAAIAKANRFVTEQINPELPLPLAIGRPKILRFTQTPIRIYLADEEIATSEVMDQQTGRELAVTGVKVGSTTLTLWFKDETQAGSTVIVSYLIQVFADPLLRRSIEELERDINLRFPDSSVELDELDSRLIVRGQARDPIEMAQILQILSGARGVQAGLQRATPIATTVGTVLNFSNDATLNAEELAAENRSLLDPVALARAGIINLMRIPGEQQVMLRVTVAEVNRNAARRVGLNFNALSGNSSFSNTTGTITGNLRALIDGDINLRLEALRTLSLSRTLAEPNLVAINGQPANFQAGGQFPIPIIAAGGGALNNLQGVQFVPFGVQLRFLPLVQDRDVIRLQVQADVSTREESLGANIGGGAGGGGTAVPGLNSRNFSTTVELRSGQTLAVAGLLQSNFGASSDRVPFWGDLPLLGFTGGVNRTSAAEQELIILVTPELVAPLDACAIPGLPGNDVYEPTDIEFFLSNRLESRRAKDFRSPARTDYAKLRRPDRCCADKFLVGGAGPTDRCCNQPAMVPHQIQPASDTVQP